jgi:hypothetical protein
MTAEISILNQQAVAMAADSALTIQQGEGQKIFASALKIFALSHYQPVGTMVYGTADLMGIPWETVVKTYRRHLGTKKLASIDDYAADFLDFLGKGGLFPSTYQDERFKQLVYSYFSWIRDKIISKVEGIIREQGRIAYEEVKNIVSETVSYDANTWSEAQQLPNIPEGYVEKIRENFISAIESAKKDVFEKLPLSTDVSSKLSEIAVNLTAKWPEKVSPPAHSGLVVAGFGDNEFFPHLRSYFVGPILQNVATYKYDNAHSVDISFDMKGGIVPFAQQEMVGVFMEGVVGRYQQLLERLISQLGEGLPKVILRKIGAPAITNKRALEEQLVQMSGKAIKQTLKKLEEYRQEEFVNPIMKVVASLPLDELAAMAEALVNLTSLKRRVTMKEKETVGGPIDVAVISKGDGLIWIKRKHYFAKELNPQFFAKYGRKVNYEEEGDKKEGKL